MPTLIYQPNYSYITNYSSEFLEHLSLQLKHWLTTEELELLQHINSSIKLGNEYIFTNATIHNRDTLIIYSGYLKQILANFPRNRFKLNITSRVTKYVCSNSISSNILYDHQKQIVSACLQNNRGIVKSPTGSGKSFSIAELVRKYTQDKLKVLITVPTIELMHQLTEDIKKYYHLNNLAAPAIGKVGAGLKDFKDITVGIPNSLSKDVCIDYLATVDAHLCDEVHTACTGTYSLIVDRMLNRKVALGFSATPWVNNNKDILLTGFFGDSIIEISEAQMIDSKIIMEPEFKFYPAPKAFVPNALHKHAVNIKNLSAFHRYKTLHQVYEYVISNNSDRNQLIAKLTKERIELNIGPVILIVNKIKGDECHGIVLQNLLLTYGCTLPIISGYIGKKKKEDLINQLKDNKISGCIAGPKVLSTGINIPCLSTVILAGAGKSNTEFIQRVGRILRQSEGKIKPLVIDFNDPQYWFNRQSFTRLTTAKEVYGKNSVTCE